MLRRSELVGRGTELAAFEECLGSAAGGHPRLVVCQGEPGIGKTRLAEELLASAAAKGIPGVWGTAVDTEGVPPYWPWLQGLRGVAERVDLTALAGEHRLTAPIDDRARRHALGRPCVFAASPTRGAEPARRAAPRRGQTPTS